ncbi:hypothetical protein [Cohnella herbarum]|uniref:Uncharacterized protein n=1 Tax=Cohnella herbarum TaxID=2728023 RepID=A0A7Z2VEU4_9BACL|nr:hypothetical protein [Cohnella herbarum]QJD81896.1 hypothetical protein HH215_01000 [Cohnella herbarum]
MPRYSPARLKIWGALLLSVSLVSCSSSPIIESASGPASDPPAISSPEWSPEDSSPEEAIIQTMDPPAVTPEPSQPAASKHPDAASPPVEVSTIQPKSTEPEDAPNPAFQPKSPSLASIKLGVSDKEVVKRYGLPSDTYLLPGDKQTVNIWEYDGYSIGLNDKDKVVYVEISSSGVNTGIQGLLYGMSGSEAAQLLGIPNEDHTNVLALEVSGGWLKLDLDPDTQKVLSLKLLSREI